MSKYDAYKESLMKYGKWLSETGYFGALMGTGGNVSMRIKGEKAIGITPSGMSYKDLTPDDICILDFEKTPIEGNHSPSVESGMHIEVYKKRLDVNAVIHTHQIKGSVFSIINHPMPALFDEVCLHIGEIADIVPYALSGSPELTENVSSKLDNNCHCYILQNHGVLCLGNSMDQTCLNAELLEKNAAIYAEALSTGNDVTLLPEDIVNLLKIIRNTGYAFAHNEAGTDGRDHANYAKTDQLLYGMRRMHGKLPDQP